MNLSFDFAPPRTRATDPTTSQLAAAAARSGNALLLVEITHAVLGYQPCSAFQIADVVEKRHPGRWDEGSIRTAVSRHPRLVHVDNDGRRKGRPVRRYALKETP